MVKDKKTKVRHIPIRLLILTAGSLLLVEALIMFFLLPNMPPMSQTAEAIFDAFILTALVFPILYIFLFRPMILHITERKRAEESMKLAYAELNQVFQTAAGGMRVIDKEFNMLRINETFARLAGTSKNEATGKKCYAIFQSIHCHTPRCSMKRVLNGEERIEFESIRQRTDGTTVPCIVNASAFRDQNNEIIGIVEDFKDMVEYKRLEKQLIQAQKMEAIGQLAGGIAHDFNNILTAIMGYGNLLNTEIEQEELKKYVSRILKSTQRAANLTKSLLAFSRGQIITPRPENLNEIVRGVENLLISLMGEDVEFVTILIDKKLTVLADAGQIEQVLMNLATNARDAMKASGKFIIRTDQVELNNEFIKNHGYGNPGTYALITIEDTGQGIDEETKEKIFEPFFTTKEVGKGTGLGLSMVYGIIQQHDGYIDVQSELGKGAIFEIYLPIMPTSVEEIMPGVDHIMKGGTETVLVAEDDIQVRELTKEVLEGSGYKVLEATNGENALSVFNNSQDSINLLLLDVIMPKKNGKEVYDAIRQKNQDIKAIFISGYDADIIQKKGFMNRGVNFISKPVSPDELLYKVREVLDH
jgi:PAS domain S-box-containing protein